MYKMLRTELAKLSVSDSDDEAENAEEEKTPRYKKVTNAKELVRGIFAFEDLTKGGLRLTIQGHGHVINGKGWMVDAKRNHYDGDKLKTLLEAVDTDFSKYTKIRLVCCHSADGNQALAQQVANMSNVKTKGYSSYAIGHVSNSMLRAFINNYDQFTDRQKEMFEGTRSYMTKGTVWLDKIQSFGENSPETFLPGTADIIEDNPGAFFAKFGGFGGLRGGWGGGRGGRGGGRGGFTGAIRGGRFF